jgi:lipopolysaccharide export system permease protein
MKRLHQYVLKSFLGPFFMTFFICVFILLMQFLWKYIDDMVGKGLEWGIVAELLLYASMGLVPMAFPLATLLASIMTFGSLGENYELVAMKASGISLFRIMKPLVFVAIGLAFFAFFFSNNILPQTNLKLTALMASIKKQKPEMVITEGIFTNDIDGYSIKVDRKSKKSNMLYKILIYDHTENQGNVSVTVADSGFMKISEDKKFMIMTLFSGETDIDEDPKGNRRTRRYTFRRTHFQKQVVTVPLRGFDFRRTDEDTYRNAYRMLTLGQLEFAEDSLYNDYNYRVRRFAINMRYNQTLNRSVVDLTITTDSLKTYHGIGETQAVNFDSLMVNLDPVKRDEVYQAALSQARMNKQTIDQNVFELYNIKKNLNRYSMEKHRKFTWSVACLIFFFIGAPLGAIIRKGGLGMPTVVSILMFILYYMVAISGEKAAREDIWTMFEGMWLSTFIFFPLGFFLTYKAATDSGLLNVETYQYKIKKFVNYILRRKNDSVNSGYANSATNK